LVQPLQRVNNIKILEFPFYIPFSSIFVFHTMSSTFILAEITVFVKSKARFFPEIWHLNMSGRLKFTNEAPNQITQK